MNVVLEEIGAPGYAGVMLQEGRKQFQGRFFTGSITVEPSGDATIRIVHHEDTKVEDPSQEEVLKAILQGLGISIKSLPYKIGEGLPAMTQFKAAQMWSLKLLQAIQNPDEAHDAIAYAYGVASLSIMAAMKFIHTKETR